jgi:predicted N-acetyltransferase YhbS
MAMSEAQALPTEMTTRSYEPGDEFKIIDLLNLCYGAWGDLDRWRALYANYPNFTKDDVFIVDNQGEVIGHRGLHFRQVEIGQRHRVPTVSLGDTAVHPQSRGLGLYASLHQVTLQEAESRGASLAFTWNLKGSTTYDHNRKTGFVELRQTSAYVRIVNPGKVLRSGLSDFIHKNQKLRGALQDLGNELYFSLAEAEFSVADLVGDTGQQPKASGKAVKLVFAESSLSFLANFRTMSKLQRVRELTLLLLCRRVKIRFGSPVVSLRVARKMVGILGYL